MLAYEWRVFLPKLPGHRELQPKYRPGLKELSQKEHSFIKKCNFCDNLKFLKTTFFGMQVQRVKNAPWLEH
jgi:hypothetical protein